MPVNVTPLNDPTTRELRVLVSVTEDFMLSEVQFRETMTTMLERVVDEAVRHTMVKFGDAMNEVLSLNNLRNLVVAELQKRIREVKPDASV